MTNLVAAGESFALIALETRSAVDLPVTELVPGLWASSTSIIGLDHFWKQTLGTSKIENFRACTLSLLVKDRVADPSIEQELRDRVWRFYAGMLLAARFGVEQDPFLISGDCKADGLATRWVGTLAAAPHAAADRWQRLTTDDVRRGAKIGRELQKFPWRSAYRLNRVLTLFLQARTLLDWMERIHQYTRCLDGLTIPPGGGAGKKFADRMMLIAGPAHRDMFEEIYAIRGAIEHLRENDYTEPFDRARRIELMKKAGIVEHVARSALVRILETELLWEHFKTKESLLAFWELPLSDRETLWGETVDPMDGIKGFDETQYSDAELGKR